MEDKVSVFDTNVCMGRYGSNSSF